MATGSKPSPAHRAFIDAAIGAACRRHRLRPGDAQDYASIARLRLSKDDIRTLGAPHRRGASRTRLVAILARAFVEWQQARWGAWRPSAEARRLGTLAIQLDTLISRDGFTPDEAIETMWVRRSGAESREQIEALSACLPGRAAAAGAWPGARAGLAAVGAAPAASAPAAGSVGTVAPRDRLVLQMGLGDGFGAVEIAEALGLDRKSVSRLLEHVAAAGADTEAIVPIQPDAGLGFGRALSAGRQEPAGISTDGGCLDAERLARLLDGRVNASERSHLEAHLARCARCYDVFVEAIRLRAFLADDPDVRLAARRGRLGRGATLAGAGLALAAAVWRIAGSPAAASPEDSRRAGSRPKR